MTNTPALVKMDTDILREAAKVLTDIGVHDIAKDLRAFKARLDLDLLRRAVLTDGDKITIATARMRLKDATDDIYYGMDQHCENLLAIIDRITAAKETLAEEQDYDTRFCDETGTLKNVAAPVTTKRKHTNSDWIDQAETNVSKAKPWALDYSAGYKAWIKGPYTRTLVDCQENLGDPDIITNKILAALNDTAAPIPAKTVDEFTAEYWESLNEAAKDMDTKPGGLAETLQADTAHHADKTGGIGVGSHSLPPVGAAELPLYFLSDKASDLAADLVEAVRKSSDLKSVEGLGTLYGAFQEILEPEITALEKASLRTPAQEPDAEVVEIEERHTNTVIEIQNNFGAAYSSRITDSYQIHCDRATLLRKLRAQPAARAVTINRDDLVKLIEREIPERDIYGEFGKNAFGKFADAIMSLLGGGGE